MEDTQPPADLEGVDLIIWHEAAADALDVRSDEHRWSAAEEIFKVLEAGKSGRSLAAEIGKSHVHVGRMAKVWQEAGNLSYQDRERFNTYYNSPEVRGAGKNSAPKSRNPAQDHIEELQEKQSNPGDEEAYNTEAEVVKGVGNSSSREEYDPDELPEETPELDLRYAYADALEANANAAMKNQKVLEMIKEGKELSLGDRARFTDGETFDRAAQSSSDMCSVVRGMANLSPEDFNTEE